jgi:hypothetical protein
MKVAATVVPTLNSEHFVPSGLLICGHIKKSSLLFKHKPTPQGGSMKLGNLIAIVMLISSMNLFADENIMDSILATKGTNKGTCANLCNYACTTD